MIQKFEGRWSFLSNFYPCEIEHQGIKYPSVEHYYVALKVNDQQLINGKYYTPGDFREMISKIEHPGVVKKIGSKIKLRSNWDDKKFTTMEWGVREKFKNPKLAGMLVDTGDVQIIEGNLWHDNFYGQCLCDKCKGSGKNKLGKLLMQIRDELKGVKRTGLEEFLK